VVWLCAEIVAAMILPQVWKRYVRDLVRMGRVLEVESWYRSLLAWRIHELDHHEIEELGVLVDCYLVEHVGVEQNACH